METVLLIRRAFPYSHWEKWTDCESDDEAEKIYNKEIKGKGVTGMAWWGSKEEGERMLMSDGLEK